MPEPKFWDEDSYSSVHGSNISNQALAVAAPTKAEFDSLAGKVNAVLAALRSAGIIEQD